MAAGDPTTIVEGFSISHAAILNGTTALDPTDKTGLADIYGVREGTLDVNSDSYDNTGDDTVLSTWAWINFATIAIKSGYVPFNVIALLTGATLTSSGTSPNINYSLPLWNQGSANQPTRPVLLSIPSKDSAGLPRQFMIVLYKVQFNPITFDGPTYKDGLALNYGGKALMSANDEAGVALPQKAIGRLVSVSPVTY